MDATIVNQVEVPSSMKKLPKWIDSMLEKTCFGTCPEHEHENNELNRYCITCDSHACQFCVLAGAHKEHHLLKLYRHCHRAVVSLTQITDLTNCSNIQRYRCNKQAVLALHPLPHNGSGIKMNKDATCDICQRRLFEPSLYRYCSISCKVKSFKKKKRNRRKGRPFRAPFY